ncbi:MAG: hypothetical protein AAFX80_21850 [Cyanobacteria bacterium J06639_18]
MLKILSQLLATGLLLNVLSLPSEAWTINYPKYKNLRIDACVVNMGCNESSISYAANQYCKLIGYTRETYWETKKYPRRKRKQAWRLEYRPSGSTWYSHKGGHLFSRIDCSY